MLGNYVVRYMNGPPCTTGCWCTAEYSDVTISKENEETNIPRLTAGQSYTHKDDDYNIDITFLNGSVQVCIGPAGANFVINIKPVSGISFNYYFAESFTSGDKPLGEETDPQNEKPKEAVIKATKIWEDATNGNISFAEVASEEEADIIFEGWSKQGPMVLIFERPDGEKRDCLSTLGVPIFFKVPAGAGWTTHANCEETNDEYPAKIFFHTDPTGTAWAYQDKGSIMYLGAIDIVKGVKTISTFMNDIKHLNKKKALNSYAKFYFPNDIS